MLVTCCAQGAERFADLETRFFVTIMRMTGYSEVTVENRRFPSHVIVSEFQPSCAKEALCNASLALQSQWSAFTPSLS